MKLMTREELNKLSLNELVTLRNRLNAILKQRTKIAMETYKPDCIYSSEFSGIDCICFCKFGNTKDYVRCDKACSKCPHNKKNTK